VTRSQAADALPDDFRDLFAAFHRSGVDFVLIGAHALARHGYVRATLDLDVFVRPTPTNATRVMAALADFGAPLVPTASRPTTSRDRVRSTTSVYHLAESTS